jgi:hypothetical protein
VLTIVLVAAYAIVLCAFSGAWPSPPRLPLAATARRCPRPSRTTFPSLSPCATRTGQCRLGSPPPPASWPASSASTASRSRRARWRNRVGLDPRAENGRVPRVGAVKEGVAVALGSDAAWPSSSGRAQPALVVAGEVKYEAHLR